MVNVLANDSDAEGGALELVSVTQPASGGSVEKVGQQVRCHTDRRTGGGSFTFTYTVRDAGLPWEERRRHRDHHHQPMS